ncbi:ML domain [Popillia japonica]|uniref:ML domain n=1 Tax=Popillia japonica TaxID=7064 RepID=A0AAW1JHY9_POPJA
MDNIFISYLCFALLVSVVSATYSDCGSTLGTVSAIAVTDCKDSDAQCVLRRNSNVTIQISFVPNKSIQQINAVVHGVILGVPIPFELPNSDGCKDSGVSCPLQEGQTYTYSTTLPVLKKYPRVNVEVKFELQDQSDSDVTCSMIPSKIQ